MRNRKQVNYSYEAYDEEIRKAVREPRETSERDKRGTSSGAAVSNGAVRDEDGGRAARKRSRWVTGLTSLRDKS